MEKLWESIKASLSSKEKRLVIGIDGLSRSGKTTLAKKLVEFLVEGGFTVRFFHIDDYIAEKAERYDTGQEEWYKYYQLQWDTQWLQKYFFNSLKSTKAVCLPVYVPALDHHTWKKTVIPEKECIILIEGVFLQRREWRDYFDGVIYVEYPREVRFSRERASTQLKIEKFKTRYWKAEDYYLHAVNPKDKADLVITSIDKKYFK